MKRRLLVLLLLITLTAGGAIWWFLRPTHTTYLTDADTIRESAASASLREVLWQRPSPLVDLINTNADEFEPRVSADGGTLFFVRGKPGHNADIYTCTRERAGWSKPVALAEINTEYDELGPEPSSDGQALYFYSDRPGGLGGFDLWVARKNENGWQPPTNLGSTVNTVYNEYGPALSPDGATLCFSSNRPKPNETTPSDDAWRATVREDLYRHDYDLYSVKITDSGFQPAAPIEALNSPFNDGAPAFSPICDFLYFSSDRPIGHGGFDIYRARILHEQFQPPTNLGTAVNTAANELDPALDVGGYALHFSSDRPAADNSNTSDTSAGTKQSASRYHLYRTFSREVFHDVEVRQPVINWAALWKQIGPNLMWALLALIVFILLLALMRDLSRRRLSLLARCLIISLMIHMLLMLWFNAVQVTATIASAIRKTGPIQVSLSPASRSGNLTAQIRGGLTLPDAPPSQIPPPDRAAPINRTTVSAVPMEFAVAKVAVPREQSLLRAHVVDASSTTYAAPLRQISAANFSPSIGANFELPTDQYRSDTPEKGESTPAVNEPMKIGHHSLPPATSQPAERQRIELAVEASGTGNRSTESLVGNRPVADANTSSFVPAMVQTSLSVAMLGVTNSIDPELPSAEVKSRQSSGEVESTPLTELSAPPRAGNLIASTVGTHPEAIQQLRPEIVAPSTSTRSLIMPHGVGALDVHPGNGSLLPRTSGATFEIGNAPSPGVAGGTGYSTIDFAVPSEGPGVRASGGEGRDGSAGVAGAVTFSPVSRAGIPLSNITAPSTPVQLAPAPLAYRAQSLIVGGLPTGTGNSNFGGTDFSADRITSASATKPPSSQTTTASPSIIDLQLPDEISPPPEQTLITDTPSAPIVGRIHGRVTDSETGERVENARIQLDLPGGETMVVATDKTGMYQLAVPDLPDFFALSASKTGYLPKTRNVANRSVVGRTMRLNFVLQPRSLHVVALEESPIIHHLGNDAYEGQINSQFQRSTEGRDYAGVFDLSPEQLTVSQARIEMFTKGVQCPHKIRINGHLLDSRLANSPNDGSFGSFVAEFDASLLQVGTNTLQIRAIACNGDLDDFEFINLQIRLLPQSH